MVADGRFLSHIKFVFVVEIDEGGIEIQDERKEEMNLDEKGEIRRKSELFSQPVKRIRISKTENNPPPAALPSAAGFRLCYTAYCVMVLRVKK